MTWFEQCFKQLIHHEGGYVNDPKDPGGETKYGISKRSYPDVDIAALTLEQAQAIYLRDYWMRARCDELPPAIAFLVFDCAVNSGIGQAIRFLQRAVGVADDGLIGPMTIAAVSRVDVESLASRFLGQRLNVRQIESEWEMWLDYVFG